jgi:hypothetical protein
MSKELEHIRAYNRRQEKRYLQRFIALTIGTASVLYLILRSF